MIQTPAAIDAAIRQRSSRAPVNSKWIGIDRHYREQLGDGIIPSLHKTHIPTDWSADDLAGERALLDGWKPERGTCPDCFLVYSAAGTCNCTG